MIVYGGLGSTGEKREGNKSSVFKRIMKKRIQKKILEGSVDSNCKKEKKRRQLILAILKLLVAPIEF